MKISLLIAAIILGIGALFGLQQKEKIKHLTTEWEDLKTIALEKKISTDPKATFSAQRARSDSARAARENAIADFASELAAFAQRMEKVQESSDTMDADMQKEVAGFLDKLTNMSPSDLKSLIKALSEDNSIKDETKQELVMMSIMMISAENPEAALALISESGESLDLGKRSRHMLPMVISQYAAKDPLAAAEWILENQESLGEKGSDIKNGVIAMAAKNDLSSALALIKKLEIENPAEAFGGLANGVTVENQAQFMKALRDQDFTDEERDAALGSLSSSSLMKDFEAASKWLSGPDLSQQEKEKVIRGLGYHRVKDSPEKWISWINESQGTSEVGKNANKRIIQGWTRENFVAAGEWLQNHEEGPSKTAAVETYANTLAPHEPAAAADWADTLPPSDERTQLLQTIHRSLKEQDPSAASALAEKHQLQVEPDE